MREEKIVLWDDGEYSYERAFGFVPYLHAYLHEDGTARPCMIVAPGGGYRYCSTGESEPVAVKFYEKGFQTFVLVYTCNPLMDVPLLTQPMKDLSRAARCVRKNAARFHIRTDRLIFCGFSAAGHLCASVSNHWQDVREENPEFQAYSNRPNAVILGYPVITSGKYAHRGTIEALTGEGKSETGELAEYFSLERQVTADTPPTFLWATATDETVPVENSLLYARALKERDVPFALHIFSKGRHGLSTADEKWACGDFSYYAYGQLERVRRAVHDGRIDMSREKRKETLDLIDGTLHKDRSHNEVMPEIRVWPDLAEEFLRSCGML